MGRAGASSTAQKQEGQMCVVGLSCQAQPKTGGGVLGLGFECELFSPQKHQFSHLFTSALSSVFIALIFQNKTAKRYYICSSSSMCFTLQ